MIRRFFSYYKPHRRLFIIDFSCAVIVALLELAFPVAVQWFIDDLLPGNNWDMIIMTSILLLLVYLLSTFLQYVVTYWGHKLGVNIETDMRQELFGHVQKQSFRFFDNTKTGHIMSRITNDLFDIGELAHHGPEDFFIAIMTFVGAFMLMFNINFQLSVIILIVVPILVWLMAYSNIKMNKAWRKMYGKIAEVNGRVEDSVSGARVVQSFTNEDFEMERFTKDNYSFRKVKVGAYKVMAFVNSNIYMMMRLIVLVVLVVGAWLTFNGHLKYGELVAFILYVNVLFRPVEKISALLELYPKGMAGFKRFVDILNIDPDVVDRKDAKDVDHLKGYISFHKVTFGYEKIQGPVLKNVSFNINAGETIAFVGPSGAGKTTIVNLITRFYNYDKGNILLDGIELRDIQRASLRSHIAFVLQDSFLFRGTIRENIAYGKPNATQEEVREAARKANAHDFIMTLPNGYATDIGQRGVKLSGGQKQRLSIARVFLKDPPILIFDEATSALDNESEQAIRTSLEKLADNRTTIVIAHRLSTVRNAERIVVLSEHGIEEQGTHDALITSEGTYASLYNMQLTI